MKFVNGSYEECRIREGYVDQVYDAAGLFLNSFGLKNLRPAEVYCAFSRTDRPSWLNLEVYLSYDADVSHRCIVFCRTMQFTYLMQGAPPN